VTTYEASWPERDEANDRYIVRVRCEQHGSTAYYYTDRELAKVSGDSRFMVLIQKHAVQRHERTHKRERARWRKSRPVERCRHTRLKGGAE
jgi:hypothetical protein